MAVDRGGEGEGVIEQRPRSRLTARVKTSRHLLVVTRDFRQHRHNQVVACAEIGEDGRHGHAGFGSNLRMGAATQPATGKYCDRVLEELLVTLRRREPRSAPPSRLRRGSVLCYCVSPRSCRHGASSTTCSAACRYRYANQYETPPVPR